jgi:hypothetical protein
VDCNLNCILRDNCLYTDQMERCGMAREIMESSSRPATSLCWTYEPRHDENETTVQQSIKQVYISQAPFYVRASKQKDLNEKL